MEGVEVYCPTCDEFRTIPPPAYALDGRHGCGDFYLPADSMAAQWAHLRVLLSRIASEAESAAIRFGERLRASFGQDRR